jgi:hypothetical protein
MKKKNLLKEIIDDREDICCLYARVNEAQQEAQRAHDRHTHHILDHRANDILPEMSRLEKSIREQEESNAGLWDKLQGIDGRLVFEGRARQHNLGLLTELNASVEDLKAAVNIHLKSVTDVEILKTQVKGLDDLMNRSPFNNLVVKTQTEKIIALEKSYADTIRTFELKMKEQRSDYHDHIRQLVTENGAAHFEMKKRYDMMESADCANLERLNKTNDAARETSNAQAREILHMKEQINKLRTDYLALVEKKKPAGSPKAAKR